MEKFELEESLKEEIRAGVLGEGFMKIVQSVRRGGTQFKISIRPVEIGGERRFQAEMADDGQVSVKNFDADGIADGLEELIAQKGARDLHLMTAKGDLHVRVTKKGHVLVSRSAEMNRKVELRPHDRVKNLPLTAFDSVAFLKAASLADGEGRVRASMRGKYDQVNEFLKVVADVLKGCETREGETFTVVDCGCGKAYLTVALYLYLTQVVGLRDVRVYGVDRRADVIAAATRMAERLDLMGKVVFVESDLAAFDPPNEAKRADMVVSLHACDTATDEALAKGVEWKARYILSAPCCQHELQKSLSADLRPHRAILRNGILRERLADILTDAFRAQILRVMGYRASVVEFVDPEATARNVLIRAVRVSRPGTGTALADYEDLRSAWGVTPWLATRLASLRPELGGR